MTTVRDIGETRLIDRIAKLVADAHLPAPDHPSFDLRAGIGDDAAVWRQNGVTAVCTTDTMVEGTHFRRDTLSWEDVGWKLTAVNLSDIAAMGAVPLCAVVTLGLPADLPMAAVDALYRGMLAASARYRTLLVGGDIAGSPAMFVTMAINGTCSGDPLLRSQARPGDVIAVTGALGAAAGGLRLLTHGAPAGAAASMTVAMEALLLAHRRPQPRLEAAVYLKRAGVRCAMDISDGLVADLRKLATASNVGAELLAADVPVAPALRATFPHEALADALGGGEDYELLFAAPVDAVRRALADIPAGVIIGRVTSGPSGAVRVLDRQGAEVPVTNAGWEHLR